MLHLELPVRLDKLSCSVSLAMYELVIHEPCFTACPVLSCLVKMIVCDWQQVVSLKNIDCLERPETVNLAGVTVRH